MGNTVTSLFTYKTKDPINDSVSREFYIYKLDIYPTDSDNDVNHIQNRAVNRLNKYAENYNAIIDEDLIYTQIKIKEDDLCFPQENTEAGYMFKFENKARISISNRTLYEKYFKTQIIDFVINKSNLFGYIGGKFCLKKTIANYDKLSGQFNYIDITSRKLFENEYIKLLFQYDLTIHIDDKNYVYLSIDTTSFWFSTFTIEDMIQHNFNVDDMSVTYLLPTNTKQSGYIVSNPPKEYIEKNKPRLSCQKTLTYLKNKYIKMPKVMYKLKAIEKDTTPHHLVFCMMKPYNRIFHYIASTLRPQLTRENINALDRTFYYTIEQHTKRSMKTRAIYNHCLLKLLQDIPFLNHTSFNTMPLPATDLGYTCSHFNYPKLLAGHNFVINKQSDKHKIFNPIYGYYKIPSKDTFNILLVANNIFHDELTLKIIFSYLYIYCGLQQLSDSKKINLSCKLIPVNGISELKLCSNIHSLIEETSPDFLITILNNRDENNCFYTAVKYHANLWNIPSQNITISTALSLYKQYCLEKNYIKTPADIHLPPNLAIYDKNLSAPNITGQILTMGILGKIGAIPYIISEMPIQYDLIIALDVGYLNESKTHYPCCAVCCDGNGEAFCFYVPNNAQNGEIISTNNLKEIFNVLVINYRDRKKKNPSSVLIIRDGFFREDKTFCYNYFNDIICSVDIYEIRKTGAPRVMVDRQTNDKLNPPIGLYLINNMKKDLILVSSSSVGNNCAPRPYLIHFVTGNSNNFLQTCYLIYCLTKIYPGTTKDIRFPHLLHEADKMCKLLKILPKGKLYSFIPCL